MREGYKKTEIGVIPVEWEVVKLDSLGEIITGSTPKTSNQDFYLNGTRLWASPSDLGKSKEIKTTNTKLSDLGFEQIRVLKKRSILITCIGSTIGKMGIAYEEMSSNQQINAITCNENNNPDFYYYVLFKIKGKIQKLAGTQAVPLLNKTDFSHIKVIQPPLKEQEKIASILSTADEKIEAIAEQIEKHETLKKGLLQKLLSEGIGHTEFKESELGRVPVGWEVVKLEDIAKINMGQSPKSDTYNEDGIGLPLVQGNADCKNRKTIPRVYTSEPTKICSVGDIIMTVRAPVGAIVKSYHDACIGRGVCAIQANEDNEFLYQLLIDYEDKWEKLSQGSTFTAVNANDVKNIKLPFPPLQEQKQIADILSTADQKLEVLRAKKVKYETLKKGLLQKLLSGEVRV